MTDAEVRLDRVPAEAVGELLTLRRAAFVSEAQISGNPNIPPLTQTLAELREDMAREDVITIGAWIGPRLVGSIRVGIEDDKATLGRLAVAPDIQGQGIGTQLLFEVLKHLPENTREVWVFTGQDSKQNLSLYAKHGFEHQYDKTAGDLTYAYLRRILGEGEIVDDGAEGDDEVEGDDGVEGESAEGGHGADGGDKAESVEGGRVADDAG